MLFATLLPGCGDKDKMHQTKIKTRGGLPAQQPQAKPEDRGKEAINLTPDLLYPGSTTYEDAKYEYVSNDDPDKVANWFQQNLKGTSTNKITTKDPKNFKYEIFYKGIEIDIFPGPHGTDTLIRYKIPLSSSGKTEQIEQPKKTDEAEK